MSWKSEISRMLWRKNICSKPNGKALEKQLISKMRLVRCPIFNLQVPVTLSKGLKLLHPKFFAEAANHFGGIAACL